MGSDEVSNFFNFTKKIVYKKNFTKNFTHKKLYKKKLYNGIKLYGM